MLVFRSKLKVIYASEGVVESKLLSKNTSLAYLVIESHADFILNEMKMIEKGVNTFHKMKETVCRWTFFI